MLYQYVSAKASTKNLKISAEIDTLFRRGYNILWVIDPNLNLTNKSLSHQL